MKNSTSHIFKGTVYAILAGVLWAFSGVFGQIFFEQYDGNALWITTFRLTIAGLILLTISLIQKPSAFLSIWKDKKNYALLFGYAIFGVLMVQLTFYACVQEAGVATATVLQFTSPIFLLVRDWCAPAGSRFQNPLRRAAPAPLRWRAAVGQS